MNGKYKSVQDVEWYSGGILRTRPLRVKVNGIWEDVFSYEKRICEDNITHKRTIVFSCHIGDNRIVEIMTE
jgi:hypothetical protein